MAKPTEMLRVMHGAQYPGEHPLARLVDQRPATADSRKSIRERWAEELRALEKEIGGVLYVPMGSAWCAEKFGRKQELEILLTVCDIWDKADE